MSFRRRVVALAVFIAFGFGGLLGRLVWLQLVEGERYCQRARDARQRIEFVRAPRGRILDRRGRVLAADYPTYRISAVLADLDPGPEISERVARILRRSRGELLERWREIENLALGEGKDGPPLSLALAPSPASVAAFERLAARQDGLFVQGRSLLASRCLLRRREETLARLARVTGLDLEPLRERVRREMARALAISNRLERARALEEPVVLAGSLPDGHPIPFEIVADLEEAAHELPGIEIEVASERRYPFGAALAHALGYVGPLEKEEVASLRRSGQLLGAPDGPKDLERFRQLRWGARFANDRVGRAGLEATYDDVLGGAPGARLVERDRRTRGFRILSEEPPLPGRDLAISIDIECQQMAEAALERAIERSGGSGGAAVLLDLRTGEVIALASAPRYDPNRFRATYAALSSDARSPLVHRAIAAELPPGSTMKAIVATAALEERVEIGGAPLGPETTVDCRGYLHSPRAFRCNTRSGHGPVALHDALVRSCNVYFYVVGEELGEARLAFWASRFGLGRQTGIDLPGERAGLVPTSARKRERFLAARERVARDTGNLCCATGDLLAVLALPGPLRFSLFSAAAQEAAARCERLRRAREELQRAEEARAWRAGDSRNVAVGQGDLRVTPLQAALVAAAIATGGRAPRPHLALDPASLKPPPPTEGEPSPLEVAPEVWRAIRSGLEDVVRSPSGTANGHGLERYDVAGKTGTAQAPGGDCAWFAGYAPSARPEVAFAVVVERVRAGLHGGEVAGPVVFEILAARAGIEGECGGSPGERFHASGAPLGLPFDGAQTMEETR